MFCEEFLYIRGSMGWCVAWRGEFRVFLLPRRAGSINVLSRHFGNMCMRILWDVEIGTLVCLSVDASFNGVSERIVLLACLRYAFQLN